MCATGYAARCWVRWNGQHSKNRASLSSCRKPKSQEGNKSFVPEPRESSVFRDSHAYKYFTYMYISHIRIMAILHNLKWNFSFFFFFFFFFTKERINCYSQFYPKEWKGNFFLVLNVYLFFCCYCVFKEQN